MGIRREVERIFPETGRGITLQIGNYPTGHVDFEAWDEWKKFPDRRRGLIESGRVRIVWTFFDKKMPDLEKIFFALYSEGQEDIAKTKGFFRKLNSKLLEIHRRVRVSRSTENVFCQRDLALAVENFNASLPPSFTRWQITAVNFGSRRLPPSKPARILGHSRPIRPRPAPGEWEFTFPVTILEIDKLINFAETWAKRLRSRPITGRPPKPFNALLFHVVNAFTQRCFTAKREYIMKDDKFRVRKNWQLVIASLLWLHVLYDIPEMRAFIKTHENEEARTALKQFVSWAKREYSHFRESGKGRGKFGPAFADGSEWLNIPWVYLREDGSLSGRLL
jgi:hypothetical protein